MGVNGDNTLHLISLIWVATYRKKVRYNIININQAMTVNKRENSTVIYKRIGSTTYKLRVHLSDTAKETMNDKILRLIQNETVTSASVYGTIGIPQMSGPLESLQTKSQAQN